MFENTKHRFDKFLILPIQLAIFCSAIVLVEVGTRAHKLFKRKFDEDLS